MLEIIKDQASDRTIVFCNKLETCRKVCLTQFLLAPDEIPVSSFLVSFLPYLLFSVVLWKENVDKAAEYQDTGILSLTPQRLYCNVDSQGSLVDLHNSKTLEV